MMKTKNNETIVILDNVRSVYNVGAIFRTADASGVLRVVLIGTTPTPVDRFGRTRADFHKSALGAENTVAWVYEKSASQVIKKLKVEGFRIFGIEQSEKAWDYREINIKDKRRVFVFGNEVDGVHRKNLSLCDEVLQLPMMGKKESLNVSVTAGIILYHFLS